MVFVGNGTKGCTVKLELIKVVRVFIAGFMLGVEFFVVIWFGDVQFVGTDADYWTWFGTLVNRGLNCGRGSLPYLACHSMILNVKRPLRITS